MRSTDGKKSPEFHLHADTSHSAADPLHPPPKKFGNNNNNGAPKRTAAGAGFSSPSGVAVQATPQMSEELAQLRVAVTELAGALKALDSLKKDFDAQNMRINNIEDHLNKH